MATNGEGKAAPIKVSLATPNDIPDLITIFWEAFNGPAESTFPHTDGGRTWLQRGFENFLGKPSHYRPESRVPVVRNANGMSNWPKLSEKKTESPHTTGHPLSFAIAHIVKPGQTVVGHSWKRRWSSADDLPDVSEERLAGFFERLARAHQLAIGKEGHVYIEFLMTKSTSRHRGYATEIVDWVTKLADDLDYACYIDGGGRGMEMLEHAGFVAQDVERRYGDVPPCVPMVRPKKQG
ncbi:hypothetical protein F5Y10DRAFT_268305 [Nemania abortiva]|nr:hypothetical protein F5Y10DRAFT_268305 [Nemania abortiva]